MNWICFSEFQWFNKICFEINITKKKNYTILDYFHFHLMNTPIKTFNHSSITLNGQNKSERQQHRHRPTKKIIGFEDKIFFIEWKRYIDNWQRYIRWFIELLYCMNKERTASVLPTKWMNRFSSVYSIIIGQKPSKSSLNENP